MAKKLIDILRLLVREFADIEYDDYALSKIGTIDIDFLMLKDELFALEMSKHIDDAEIDMIRTLLANILIKETDLDIEDIYAFIFGKGRHITWH